MDSQILIMSQDVPKSLHLVCNCSRRVKQFINRAEQCDPRSEKEGDLSRDGEEGSSAACHFLERGADGGVEGEAREEAGWGGLAADSFRPF